MSAKAKCDWGGCGRPGEYQIGLKIWALATPKPARTERNALKMMTSVCICEECRPRITPEDFLLPQGKERIAAGLLAAGRALPDFSSAKMVFDEIVGEPVDPTAFARAAKLTGKPVWEA